MWPDRVSNSGPLTYVSGALSTALRGPALWLEHRWLVFHGYFELVLESLTKKKKNIAADVIVFEIMSGVFLFYIRLVCCVYSLESPQ